MTTRPGQQLRVRRLPDGRCWPRRKQHYEVARFEAGTDLPVWVRATRRPRSVLRGEGVHPTDIHDYVAAADAAWNGATGPWCSPFPSDDQQP